MRRMKTKYSPRRTAFLAVAAILALIPPLASAQAIFRIVGPDGRVTFSDKPPASSEKATALSPGGRSLEGGTSSELPFELREAMNRYPVTLYTGDNCEPCNAARSLLNTRGVPYTERTVTTSQDVDALRRMGLQPSVHIATIGSQRLKGFYRDEWSEYLDAAGYPKISRLPSGYRNPPPSPLVPVQDEPQSPTERPAASPAPVTLPPPGPTPDNPAGIVF